MTLARHEMLIGASAASTGGSFRSTWRTTAAGETITLPLSGGAGSAYNFVVNWGDGSTDTVSSATDHRRTHTYAAPGDYQVVITGTISGWAFNNAGDRLKIISIDQWGILRFINGQIGHFYGCTKLTIPALDVPVLSNDCANMFFNAQSITTIPSISKWDVSNVTNMQNMFLNAIVFNDDLSSWNTGKVRNMNSMFSGAKLFNCGEAPGVVHTKMQRTATGGWRIGGITSANLQSMFLNAKVFAGDISNWCADVATTVPTSFAQGAHANFTTALQPTWGACPIPD